ncbi:hypothetical protein NX059_008209 [Plenodomus lindquistii]|nr:hypothetical protein NX059_008209 [Plenodomus lindquistii]
MLLRLLLTILATLAAASENGENPKDKLLNPLGRIVCMQQCGTRELRCPEAFFKEQEGPCYRCCSTWGETVIKIECKNRSLKHDEKSDRRFVWAGNATTNATSALASDGLVNSKEARPTNHP